AFLAVAFFTAFLAVAFLAVAFLATFFTAFLATAFLATFFTAAFFTVFLAATFFTAFLAVAFFAAVFTAAFLATFFTAFLAAGFLAAFFVAIAWLLVSDLWNWNAQLKQARAALRRTGVASCASLRIQKHLHRFPVQVQDGSRKGVVPKEAMPAPPSKESWRTAWSCFASEC